MKIQRVIEVGKLLEKAACNIGLPLPILVCSYAFCRVIHGASFDDFYTLKMYDYTNHKRKQILTHGRCKRISDILNKKAVKTDIETIVRKDLFNKAYKKYINREWIYLPESNESEVKSFIERNEKFLVKPTISSCGKDILLFENTAIDVKKFWLENQKKKVVLESFIKQNLDIAKLNPSSVNSIRLVTVCRDRKVMILGGALRCGGKDAFVDNFHHGGCAYPIDLNTGIITGRGRTEKGGREYIRHPSTGYIMPGFQIPNWEKIIKMVSQAALETKNLGYVGWDIAVLQDGCEIIEANVNYPGTVTLQLDNTEVYKKLKHFMNETK